MRHLTLCVLVLFIVAPTASAVWQCEGRICGTTALMCCCFRPANADALCRADGVQRAHFYSDSHQQELEPCAQDCHCTMVVRGDDVAVEAGLQTKLHTPVSFAFQNHTFAFEVPPLQPPTHALHQRGPPLRSVCPSFPSLRAPPVV